MPNYFATYGTFRLEAARRETPELASARVVGPCIIPGRLYQMGGYPVLKYGGGRVHGDLIEIPWHFDFKVFDRYEDYHPKKPWACRYLRRRIRLLAPNVCAWTYLYVWPADRTAHYPSGDWLDVLARDVKARRFRGDRMPIRRYRPAGWPHHLPEPRRR